MIFSELYSAYYNAVAAILKEGVSSTLTRDKINQIARDNAFLDSFITIEDNLTNNTWPLLTKEGKAVVDNIPRMPLTTLQKRWLKAISLDPRVKLFGIELPDFEDVSPLFTPKDIILFDKYSDGDNYEDEGYIKNFRLILDAIKNGYPLKYVIKNRNGKEIVINAIPKYLEYSEKDDKFRVVNTSIKNGETINLSRIVKCTPSIKEIKQTVTLKNKNKIVVFEIINERRALERVLLQFAHFSKEVENIDNYRYKVKLEYSIDDETELVIRILSCGPLVKVLEPNTFVNLIKDRLIAQKGCEHN